jgi:hypothetical protein
MRSLAVRRATILRDSGTPSSTSAEKSRMNEDGLGAGGGVMAHGCRSQPLRFLSQPSTPAARPVAPWAARPSTPCALILTHESLVAVGDSLELLKVWIT